MVDHNFDFNVYDGFKSKSIESDQTGQYICVSSQEERNFTVDVGMLLFRTIYSVCGKVVWCLICVHEFQLQKIIPMKSRQRMITLGLQVVNFS